MKTTLSACLLLAICAPAQAEDKALERVRVRVQGLQQARALPRGTTAVVLHSMPSPRQPLIEAVAKRCPNLSDLVLEVGLHPTPAEWAQLATLKQLRRLGFISGGAPSLDTYGRMMALPNLRALDLAVDWGCTIDAAGLAVLSRNTNLTELHLRSHTYRELGPGGEYLYETDAKRVTDRVWELIPLRRAGKPLPTHWLRDEPAALKAARLRKADELERAARVLSSKIGKLVSQLQRMQREAAALRKAAR